MPPEDVVITGVGVVSPIGIGRQAFWAALREGQSGIGKVRRFDASSLPVQIAGEVDDFDPKPFVRPRKALKVMCRDAQLGAAASSLACQEAGISAGSVDPRRFGVIFGADRICGDLDESVAAYRACMVHGQFDYSRWAIDGMAASFPLGFLKVLPNMIASHMSIMHEAQGPNNTIHHAELSGLLGIGEAASAIQRGAADVMIAGGASSQTHIFDYIQRCGIGILSQRHDDPAAAMRPFDADRDGQVWGEGAAVLIVEDRRHAERRGARIVARLLGWANCCESRFREDGPDGTGLSRAVELALRHAKVDAAQLGHVNAHGLSTIRDDRIEARALHRVVPAVPVTAPKSYFGNLGAAGGSVEAVVSVLALGAGSVPVTLNYQRPDPECPVDVIHGEPLSSSNGPALVVNCTSIGQAASLVLAGPN